MVKTTFRFGEIEAILADINDIPSVQRTSFQARLKDIQRQGLLQMETLPRGKAAAYTLRELAVLAISVELCQLGLSTKRAVEVILDDPNALWTAVMMAASYLSYRSEVFTPRDEGGDVWGFSPQFNDPTQSDPPSIFLYFDPAVLAPWGIAERVTKEGGKATPKDTASATFFFAGEYDVGNMIPRWTTGQTRRIALINVTKLMFDIAAYLAGAEGVEICKIIEDEARAEVNRGDFDLDGWLAQVTKTQGFMSAAYPKFGGSQQLANLAETLPRSFARCLFFIPQMHSPIAGDDGPDRQRPDAIIRLPGQRELRIDDKVFPLSDMPQFAIQQRIDELAEKPYHDQFADNSDWTVLYIPDDTFFANALAADKRLLDRALEQKVLIATPFILQCLMLEVDNAWIKYRAEFPDLGEEEWMGLPLEHRREWEPDYDPADSKLPPRIPYSERKVSNGDR